MLQCEVTLYAMSHSLQQRGAQLGNRCKTHNMLLCEHADMAQLLVAHAAKRHMLQRGRVFCGTAIQNIGMIVIFNTGWSHRHSPIWEVAGLSELSLSMKPVRSAMVASASARALLDVSLLASISKDFTTVLSSSVKLKLEHMSRTPLHSIRS